METPPIPWAGFPVNPTLLRGRAAPGIGFAWMLPWRFPVLPVRRGPRPPAPGVLEGTLDGLLGFLLLGYPRPHSQGQGRWDVKQE